MMVRGWGENVGTLYLPFNFSEKLQLFLKKSIKILSVAAILPLPQLPPQRICWLKRLDQFCHSAVSVTLCDPMDCRRQASLSITNSQSLLKLMSIESWCHPTISSSVVPFSSQLESVPASGSFPMSQFFDQVAKASASASVLPLNTQDWFHLGLIGLISLQSKGLSRVFSNTIVQKHWFFGVQLFFSPTLTSIHDYWKNHSFDYMDLCWQSNVSAF